ncbi:MAG: hypothetical protein V3V56_01300 [bacterium]
MEARHERFVQALYEPGVNVIDRGRGRRLFCRLRRLGFQEEPELADESGPLARIFELPDESYDLFLGEIG